MQASKVLAGSLGFTAQGFARVTALSQINFNLGRAVVRSLSPARNVPVADARLNSLFEDEGTGPVAVVKLNVEELTQASAAAWILLRRHIKTPHPETGRPEEHLVKMLVTPTDAIIKAIQFVKDSSMSRSIQQAEAEALMLGVDASARVEAIKASQAAEDSADITPHEQYFLECVKEQRDYDADVLIDDVLEAWVNAGRDPSKEIKASAKAFLAFQAKRMTEGKFVKVDGGVYALAYDGETMPNAVVAPTTLVSA